MHSRITALAAPALAALSFLGACQSAEAKPGHHHEIMPISVTGTNPGLQQVALTLPAATYNVSNKAQLDSALQSARPGQLIHLASGSTYTNVWDLHARKGRVTVSGAGDSVMPKIDGLTLEGSQYLRFTGILFTGRVFVGHSPTQGSGQNASNIQILNSDVNCGSTQTNPKTTGLVVRQASQDVTIAGDWVHNCTLGLTTIAQDNPVQNLTLEHNLFENFFGDAIDLGGADSTIIADNVVQDIKHSPGLVYHDDGIQFLGNTNATTIQDNVLDNSYDQLIFIQDAIKGRFNGVQTNSNISIDHNLIYGVGAAAVQDEGAIGLRFTNNTVWDANDGALIVRKSPYTGTPAAASLVEGNILQTYIQVSAPGVEAHNLITWVSPQTKKSLDSTDITGMTPDFESASTGDFALVPGTPGSGSPLNGTSVSLTSGASTTSTTFAAAPSAGTATMSLGADPEDYPFGAPLFGVKN